MHDLAERIHIARQRTLYDLFVARSSRLHSHSSAGASGESRRAPQGALSPRTRLFRRDKRAFGRKYYTEDRAKQPERGIRNFRPS
jgi:hypothetical protein